jgi:RES domain-containing protein
MIVYRISRRAYARDLSGTGPRLYGGRWNPKGVSVIYTSETRALAALEFYAHLNRTAILPDFCVVSLKISDGASRKEIALSGLPKDWRVHPAPPELAAMGLEWVRSGESLLLRVPSAVMPPEWSILINPAHPEMKGVKVLEDEGYVFDQHIMS